MSDEPLLRRRSRRKDFMEGEGSDQRSPSSQYSSDSSRSQSKPPRHSSSSDEAEAPPGQPSWYQFDTAVLIALIAPVGQMLTGGEHIKNLLLVVLLVWYLHQVIEVPWRLYLSTLPRTSSSSHLASSLESSKSAERSLRTMQLFFLTLAFASPFAGGWILSEIAPHLTSSPPQSFFSTGLFVLATSIRPWRHFVKRVSNRAEELHTQIHFPPSSQKQKEKEKEQDRLNEDMDELRRRMDKLDKLMAKLRNRVGDEFDELYNVVDGVQQGLSAQGQVVVNLESRVECTEKKGAITYGNAESTTNGFLETSTIPKSFISFLLYFFPKAVLPSTPPNTSTSSPQESPTKRRFRLQGGPVGLATIPEEEFPAVPAYSPPRKAAKMVYIQTSQQRPPNPGWGIRRKITDLIMFPWSLFWKMVW